MVSVRCFKAATLKPLTWKIVMALCTCDMIASFHPPGVYCTHDNLIQRTGCIMRSFSHHILKHWFVSLDINSPLQPDIQLNIWIINATTAGGEDICFWSISFKVLEMILHLKYTLNLWKTQVPYSKCVCVCGHVCMHVCICALRIFTATCMPVWVHRVLLRACSSMCVCLCVFGCAHTHMCKRLCVHRHRYNFQASTQSKSFINV